MKYLEELQIGDCFQLNSSHYIVTSDFKKDGKKFCVDLKTGYGKWINPGDMIEIIDIFTLDKDSNVIAIKERKKDN